MASWATTGLQERYSSIIGHEVMFFCSKRAAVMICVALFVGGDARASGALLQENLTAAAEYSDSRGGLSLLVVQNGRVILERYANGHTARKPWKIYSGTKAFWTISGLAAQQDGILRLDEKVSDTIAEWKRDPLKRRITMRELLNFTGGLAPGFPLHSDRIHDRNQYAQELPVVGEPPGSSFIYGPSQLQVFCQVLRRKLASRNQSPWEYLEQRILGPLGLHDLKYRKDATGTPLLATGFELTARQWARFGQLLLGEGTFRGQKIVEPTFFKESTRGTVANPAFGLGIWLNTNASREDSRQFDIEDMLEKDWKNQDWSKACICRDAPPDMFACIGSEYQRLFVIPSLDAVVVRQGKPAPFNDCRFLQLLLGR